jgi:hypothetical protein
VSDFSLVWTLSRQRLVDTISDLNDEQLNWKIHDKALSIAQMAVHVAGVEYSFSTQLLGTELDEEGKKLKAAATEGVVNDNPFPYADSELTPLKVLALLSLSKITVLPIITEPTKEILEKELVSALGPVITGEGAFTRLGFHPAYHQGQAYLIRNAPGFPA